MRAVIFLAALTIGADGAAAEALRLSHHHPVGGHLDQTAHRFADMVAERSAGALTIEVYPGAQLGQEREAFELLNQGILDMTLTSVGLMDRYWPPIEVTSLPFVWESWDHADRALAGMFGEALIGGMRDATNALLLGIIGGGFRDMVFREQPITTVAEMSGVRMRSPEANAWIRMFELLDARPTPVTWGEIYTAMQTGVAAGLEAPPLSVTDMKLQEIMGSVVLTQHMFLTYALVINENRFDGLSPELQAIIQEAGSEAVAWSNEFAKTAMQEAYQLMRDAGMEIVEPADREEWADAMRPLWDEVTAKHPDSDAFLQLLLDE